MGLFSGPREKRYDGFTANFSSPPIPSNSRSTPYGGIARAEGSMQSVAIWAAVSLVASLAAELPIDVFSGQGDGKKKVSTPGYLLDIAGDGYGTPDWVYQSVVSYLLRGNVFGKVVARDSRGGFPTQVPLYHPDDVYGWRDPNTGMPKWRAQGMDIPAADMWHRRAYSVPGYLLGLSPIGYHAMTIGLGFEAQRFGVDFFRDGANPTGLLTNSETDLKKEQAQTAKDRFVAALNGTREPVVLGKGWSWQQISIAPEESQFLETQRYSSSECARIFGPGMPEILGYPTGDPLTYATVEGRSLHLLTYALDPWFTRLEYNLSSLLPRPQYVKLNRAALLRADLLTRYRAHNMAIAGHWKAPSEVRDDEDMPPMTDTQLAELQAFDLPDPALDQTKEKTT
jgi:HK97 family phage portal protein